MIKLIVAIGKNNELGKNGGLIWHLPNDLKFFKETTMGCPVAMGSVTFNSLPKCLPGRKHIVLSYPDEMFNKPLYEIETINDKEQFILKCKGIAKNQDIFIIGGASIYSMFIDIVDEMYITEIDAEDPEADVYFPKFFKDDWIRERIAKNSDGDIHYEHVKYIRKK